MIGTPIITTRFGLNVEIQPLLQKIRLRRSSEITRFRTQGTGSNLLQRRGSETAPYQARFNCIVPAKTKSAAGFTPARQSDRRRWWPSHGL